MQRHALEQRIDFEGSRRLHQHTAKRADSQQANRGASQEHGGYEQAPIAACTGRGLFRMLPETTVVHPMPGRECRLRLLGKFMLFC